MSPAARKRKLVRDIAVPLDNIKEEYILISKRVLLANYKKQCEKCKHLTLDTPSLTTRRGAVYKITSECRSCGEKSDMWSSYRFRPNEKYDVNMKLVQFALENNGYKTIQSFEQIMETKILTRTTFFTIAKEIEAHGIADSEIRLREARELVHKYTEQEEPDSPVVKNITVTCDSSWSKRGFVAKCCVVPVVHFETGLVIDYELLSKYYHTCENHKDNEGDWYAAHEPQCQNNFEGSSPAMETEGWLRLWKRSVEKCNFRYTTVISDGDSKAYSAIVNEKVYGEVEITKDECTNHVSKRVGKAIRDYVQEKSKRGEGVGGRKRGSLTQVTIGKIQKYYTYAIIRNQGDREKR
ncbi:hypothetical protein Pmani_012487 [Petrolisthes manimaculis]|uniref:Mutator-like transposase domain-containing protein n=1 Tax=Petrolisthes manimaculis TaxID=1843537 RepID=A0AAE1PXX3_9EUCA|nr:hypothetical protein Pmani_012487 [Petrolisthes manimaculis]